MSNLSSHSSDSVDKEDDDDSDSAGNVQTFYRVCSHCFTLGSIYYDTDLGMIYKELRSTNALKWLCIYSEEICLSKEGFDGEYVEADSWSINGFRDLNQNNKESDTQSVFVTQNEVWTKFCDWFINRFELKAGSVTVLALGGAASGKSYNLFGDRTTDGMGIVPRWLEYIFMPTSSIELITIQFTMLLINDEIIYDLYKPYTSYQAEGNLAYSPLLGNLFLPAETIQAFTLSEALEALHLGLLAAATLSSNLAVMTCINSSQLILQIRLIGKTGIFRMTFAEGPSTSSFPASRTEVDGLSGFAMRAKASQGLLYCSSVEKNSQLNFDFEATRRSVFTYLIHDSVFQFPDCFILGCLRGDMYRSTRITNSQTLNLIKAIKYKAETAGNPLLAIDMNSAKSMLENETNSSQSFPSKYSETEKHDFLRRKIDAIRRSCRSFGLRVVNTATNVTALSQLDIEEELEWESRGASRRSSSGVAVAAVSASGTGTGTGANRKGSVSSVISGTGAMSELMAKRRPPNALRKWLSDWGVDISTVTSLATDVIDKPHLRPVTPSALPYTLLPVMLPAGTRKIYVTPRKMFLWGDADSSSGYHQATSMSSRFAQGKVLEVVTDDADVDELKEATSVAYCVFANIGDTIRIRPLIVDRTSDGGAHMPAILLNSKPLLREEEMKHGDVLCFGEGKILQLCIPSVCRDVETRSPIDLPGLPPLHWLNDRLTPYETGLAVSYLPDLQFTLSRFETEQRHLAHAEVVRELAAVAKLDQMTDAMKTTHFSPSHEEVQGLLLTMPPVAAATICELILACRLATLWGRYMDRPMKFSVHVRPLDCHTSDLEIAEGIDDNAITIFSLDSQLVTPLILMEDLSAGPGGGGMALGVLKNSKASKNNFSNSNSNKSGTSAAALPYAQMGAGGVWWSVHKFQNRFSLIRQMYTEYLTSWVADTSSSPSNSNSNNRSRSRSNSQLSFSSFGFTRKASYDNNIIITSAADANVGNNRITEEEEEDDEEDSDPVEDLNRSETLHIMFNDKYVTDRDPFHDVAHSELIGVAFLYLDAIQYLLDVREPELPIASFQGRKIGTMNVSIRCWIDSTDTSPAYISVDKECNILDFLGRTIIMRFQFDALYGITPQLINYIGAQLQFKLLHNSQIFRSNPLSAGWQKEQNPLCPRDSYSVVWIRQSITHDFVSFVQHKGLEIEVWGMRSPLTLPIFPDYVVGEEEPEIVPEKKEVDRVDSKQPNDTKLARQVSTLQEDINTMNHNIAAGGGGGGAPSSTVSNSGLSVGFLKNQDSRTRMTGSTKMLNFGLMHQDSRRGIGGMVRQDSRLSSSRSKLQSSRLGGAGRLTPGTRQDSIQSSVNMSHVLSLERNLSKVSSRMVNVPGLVNDDSKTTRRLKRELKLAKGTLRKTERYLSKKTLQLSESQIEVESLKQDIRKLVEQAKQDALRIESESAQVTKKSEEIKKLNEEIAVMVEQRKLAIKNGNCQIS